jgi:type IX secretion system PorP/SprF family membrane protein
MKFLSTVLAVFWVTLAFGQQEVSHTMHMLNPSAFNPGYTGSRGTKSVLVHHRSQWVGLDGAPTTTLINAQGRVLNSLGIGLNVISDKIGVLDKTDFSIDLAAGIPLGNDNFISLGLKMSANMLNIRYMDLPIYDLGDQAFDRNVQRGLTPNVGAGIFYYSNNGYFGISVPYIFQQDHFSDPNGPLMYGRDVAHYYATGARMFEVSDQIILKPAFMVQWVPGVDPRIDAGADIIFNNRFSIGGAYRLNTSFMAMAGVQLNDNFYLGYAHDFSTTEIRSFQNGSHEIFLRFELPEKAVKIFSPRFF